ncbi:hypothetical protein OWR28_20845 [Chryseobacterium sp. 1B4]
MKKLKYISFAIIGFLSLASCESDLDTAPTDQANSVEVFKTAESAETVVNGTWAKFNNDGTTYANIGYSTVLRASDAMGSDVAVLTNKYGFASTYAFTEMVNSTASRPLFIWSLLYSTINNMNNVITRIDGTEGSQEKKTR